MPWVRVDDNFHSHPKVVSVGLEAAGLFVMSLTYSAQHLTDGKVPLAWVREKAHSKTKKLAQALVDHGLWEEDGDDWKVPKFHEYNPSAAQVRTQRSDLSAKRAEAGRRGAEATNRKRWGQ